MIKKSSLLWRANAATWRDKRRAGYLALTVTGMGLLLWRMAGFLGRLYRQPRLKPRQLPSDPAALSTPLTQALRIAVENLQSCIEPRRLPDGSVRRVLAAGYRNFREPWARDLSFASFGLVELGELGVVRDTLDVFFGFQRPSGQLPVKVHSNGVAARYLHTILGREQPTTAPLRPKYHTGHRTISLDGNALLVIAACNFARRTGDDAYARQRWPALTRAIEWVAAQAASQDGLLVQDPFSDWADSIARSGRVLYTNVVYWKALSEMANAAQRFNWLAEAARWQALAGQTQSAIQAHFWRANQGYFVTSADFHNLSSSGNLLAIAWDLATPMQSERILQAMESFGMADPVPTQVVHAPYPSRFIAFENRLAGLSEYHMRAAWLWLGAWHVVSLARCGHFSKAKELLGRLAAVILRDGAVHEVYGPHGQYLATRWYTSEAPLTWSAGMLVYAYYELLRGEQSPSQLPGGLRGSGWLVGQVFQAYGLDGVG